MVNKASTKKAMLYRSQYSQSEVAKKKEAASNLPSVKVANGLEQQAKLRPAGRLALRGAENPPNLEDQMSPQAQLVREAVRSTREQEAARFACLASAPWA